MENTPHGTILSLYIDRVRYQEAMDQVQLKLVECDDEISELMNKIRNSFDDQGICTPETHQLGEKVAAAHRKHRFWFNEACRVSAKLGATLDIIRNTP